MDTNPTLIRPPDPPPPQSQNFDLSPLEFLLALFAVIIIPTFIYTFFLFLKCPPIPFFRHRRQTSSDSSSFSAAEELTGRSNTEVVTDVKYNKEVHVKGVGGGECPVCLSAFVDGEEVRQLTVCKHYFHASCIDMWLHSHSSCPVCRASVAVKGSDRRTTSVVAGEGDFRQGLPDSSSLV